MYHYTESGLNKVYLKNGYEILDTSEGPAVAIHDIEGLHGAISLDLVHRKPRLAGREFRFLRTELDMSQARLAAMLGTTDQAVARWEKGKTRVPKMADRFLRALYRETAEGNAHIIEMVNRLNDMDIKEWKQRNYERADDGWKVAA